VTKHSPFPLALCLALVVSACATTASSPTTSPATIVTTPEMATSVTAPSDEARAAESPSADAKKPAPNNSSSVLYARDGSVVATEAAGAQKAEVTPRVGVEAARELGDRSGTRVYMVELYQKALEDKTALVQQVQALEAELEHSRAACNDGDKVREGLRSQMDALMKERDQLRADTLDLAARLTTTQLRRLEAEKKLLEMQIEAQRREDADAMPRETIKPAPKTKKTPGEKP
jgi:hypothetical protein